MIYINNCSFNKLVNLAECSSNYNVTFNACAVNKHDCSHDYSLLIESNCFYRKLREYYENPDKMIVSSFCQFHFI